MALPNPAASANAHALGGEGGDGEAFRPRTVGRYILYDVLGSGGFATVYLACLSGPGGFERLVALKRHLPSLGRDPELRRMLLDEARLSASIRHPSVVSTLDVFTEGEDVYLAMDYINGLSLSALAMRAARSGAAIPLPVATRIAADVLEGLHAAHTATDMNGVPLGIVHRDVSPQNVLVGVDGIARVSDFGIATAEVRLQTTEHGSVKGKASYMAPEQLRGEHVDPRADVFGAAVVLWELVCGERLFAGTDEIANILMVLEKPIPAPRTRRPDVPEALSAVLLRGLSRDPSTRYESAHAMAIAIENALTPAPHRDVGTWVRELGGGTLAERSLRAEAVETTTRALVRMPSSAPPPPLQSIPAPPAAPAPPVPARRGRTLERGLLALAIVVGVTVLVRTESRRAPSPRDGAGRAATSPSARPADSTAAAVGSGSAPTSTPMAASASGATSTSASASASALPSRAPAPTLVAPRRPPRPNVSPSHVNCKPPYTIDPSGIHIPKPECLPGEPSGAPTD